MSSSPTRSISANAMVTSEKKAPRSRKHGYPIAPPTAAATMPPASMPIQGDRPAWR